MFKITLFNRVKPIFILVVLMILTSFSTNIYAQLPPASPYANGNAIVIGTNTGAGEYNWTNGIYGGSNTAVLTSTDLTLSSTKTGAGDSFGGSLTGNITGLAKLTYNGNWNPNFLNNIDNGYQTYHLYGANKTSGTVDSTYVEMNSGWVRGWLMGGGAAAGTIVTGNTRVLVTGGFMGGPLGMTSSGQGELYGGGVGTVNGNTYVTIRGNKYVSPQTSNMTIFHQHVLGGGSQGGTVKGNTYVNIEGGSIYGMVLGGSGGGGIASNVEGSTFVTISGGEITTFPPDTNGGNVFGGGYAANNNILGDANVYIFGSPYIKGSVYGGGRTSGLTSNTVNGNATVIIENGTIDGSIYAGGQASFGSGKVNGIATVILKDMNPSNNFALTFNKSILRGGIGTSGKANMVFDNYTAINKATIGATSGAFDTLTFKNNSTQIINPLSNYFSKSWVIEAGSSVEFTNITHASSTIGTFSNGGLVTLESSDTLLLNLRGNYLALENGKLVMGATSNTAKDYLQIVGSAKKDNGKSTTIQLTLTPGWDGSRIDLVQAAVTGSEADVFVLGTSLPSFPGRTVGFYSRIQGNNIVWYIEATCNPFSATISGPTVGCSGKEYIFTSNGTRDNLDFVWTITNGTIVWGQGTNEIGATFTDNATIKLKYKNQSGCESDEATYTITIDQTPTFGTFTVPADCLGNLLVPTVPAVTGTYTGTPFWTLDGATINIDTYRTTEFDNGKSLQYNVNTTNCGTVSSSPVSIVVKNKPTIVKVIGLPDTLCLGSQVNATVTAVHNGTQALTYRWVLDNIEIGNTNNLIYTPVLADNGKVVTVSVTNECGTVTTQHTVVITGNQTTTSNSSLAQTIGLPNGYITHAEDAANIEELQLPDKYWENTNYMFYTTDNVNYVDNQEVWLNRTGINDKWVLSTPNVGYKFKVFLAPNNLFETLHSRWVQNTTVVLDEGTYMFNLPTGGDGQILQFGDWDVKIFGLKNVILQSYATAAVVTTAFRIACKENCVVENVTVDGGGNTFSDYAFVISEEDNANYTLNNLILKDVTIKNAVTKASSNRSIISFIGMNNRPGKTIKTYARIYNLTIDASCAATGTGGSNGAVQIYGSSNLYFKNLDVRFVPTQISENALQVTVGSSLVAPSTNIILDHLSLVSDSILGQRLYTHELAFSEDYRYVRYQIYNGFPNLDTWKLFKAMPGFYANNNIVYDKTEGYWIIPSDGTTTARLSALKSFYVNYKAGHNNSLTGAPMPNIKLVANASGEISGFNVPDFGVDAPVNIVAVRNAADAVSQGAKMVMNPANKIQLLASNASSVSLYNIDFDLQAKYTLPTVKDSILNSAPGNFYNCVFSTYGNGELLKINIANPNFSFGNAAACAPAVVDLKNLTLTSGDTTGLTLKYYDMNDVELLSTVISTLGTTSYKIVGTHPKGCSYTTTVSVTINNVIPAPVITGPIMLYPGIGYIYQGDGAAQNATGYSWGTNMGNVQSGQDTNEAVISWDAPGTDVISLTYSFGACQGTGTLDVHILDQDSLIDGGISVNDTVQCYIDNNFIFTNTTKVTLPNEIVSYLWDFGDGSTSTEINAVHKYTKGGTYTVTLIAYGTLANDTVTQTIRILAPSMERPSDQVVCADNLTQEVVFKGNADLYSWKNSISIGLADGSDPIHILPFTAKNSTKNPVIDTIVVTPHLKVNDLVCLGDTVKFRITVNPITVPTITGGADACSGSEVTYTTESGMSNYDWKVVGGQIISGGSSTDNTITIRWNSSGSGNVSVDYTNTAGCKASGGGSTKIVILQNAVTILDQPSSSVILCSGEPLSLSVIASGFGITYQWYLNGAAIAGATGSTYNVASGKPSNSGDYYAVVTGACNSVRSNTSSVSVSIPDIVVQKWENVLAVLCLPSENGGYEFVDFQWYKNGSLMQGEVKSYLYVSGVIDYSAVYSVRLTTKTGAIFYTCGRTFIPKNQILVNPYPNPVGKGQTLTVDISGVSEKTAVDWVLTDYKGMMLQRQALKGNRATITMPGVSGIYILRVNIGTTIPESKYFKIIVN